MTQGIQRAKRARTATESLLSIVLGLEAVLTFFITVTAIGLKALPLVVAIGGGVALLVAFVASARLMRYPVGVWIGWALQVVLIATGTIMSLMFFIGAGFAALWVYCFVTGRRLDARNASTRQSIARPPHQGAT